MNSKIFFLISLLLLSTFLGAQGSWHILPNAPVASSRTDDIFFINRQQGWCANSDGRIMYTPDGGNTWQLQFAAGGYFRCIEFRDSLLGFAGTLNQRLYRTTNGGINWTNVASQITPVPDAICGIDIADSTTVYAVGQWDTPAFFLKSTDEGLTWTRKDMSQWASGLVEIQFFSRDTGFISGRGAGNSGGVILYTTDGGTTWTKVHDTGQTGEYVWKLQRVTEEMWVASVQTFAPGAVMLKSVDRGQTWQPIVTPSFDMQGIGFVTPLHGWVGGYSQGMYETTDGGLSWSYMPVGGNYNRIFVIDSTLAFGAGQSVYKYSDTSASGISDPHTAFPPHLDWYLTPNPTDAQITAVIKLEQESLVRMTVINAAGTEQKEVFHQRLTAGEHRLALYVGDLPAGQWWMGVQLNHGLHALPFIRRGK